MTANNGEQWRVLENVGAGAAVAGNLQKSPIFSSGEQSAAPGKGRVWAGWLAVC
jgi:hypothetical protein